MKDRRQWDRSARLNPEVEHQANRYIQSPQIRLIDENGENQGVMATEIALNRARNLGLDLITISRDANPPVCKIYDLRKHIYEQKKVKKEQEKKNRENAIIIKEVQLRPAIDEHDLLVKQRNAKNFLEDNHKVKIVMKFRGREIAFAKNGFEVIRKFLEGLGDFRYEREPSMSGNTIMVILAPPLRAKT